MGLLNDMAKLGWSWLSDMRDEVAKRMAMLRTDLYCSGQWLFYCMGRRNQPLSLPDAQCKLRPVYHWLLWSSCMRPKGLSFWYSMSLYQELENKQNKGTGEKIIKLLYLVLSPERELKMLNPNLHPNSCQVLSMERLGDGRKLERGWISFYRFGKIATINMCLNDFSLR